MEVRFDRVTKRFGSVVAVDDVSFAVSTGELFFLVGPSGCGKTTILRTVAGFYQPDAGAVWFGDRKMDGVPAHKRNAGMVFQNYALWPHMTVGQNVAYGLRVRGLSREEVRRRVDQALDVVRMPGYADRLPNQLSGGQQQRVALARALV
ncbi:MAG: ATP-binding cassette domain-containing protein, partial [Verrucomicrobiota bacterium]|nr:ATP-binding cassette domain-containing protein [Verrucomicrobiota bacterium]